MALTSEPTRPAPPRDSRLGAVLDDRYRLVDVLAVGGMGTVYRAENIRIRRRVAVKVLHPEFARNPAEVARFHREAQIAVRLSSPHVVEVLDFGRTAGGELYLVAHVPAYDALRTFAVGRIQSLTLEKQTFTPTHAVGDDIFANSLGVNTGPALPVEIAFTAPVAPYVRARVWHTSQAIRDDADGGVTLRMEVCHDWALRSWILSWGPFARVTTPASLAHDIQSDLQAADAAYHVRQR